MIWEARTVPPPPPMVFVHVVLVLGTGCLAALGNTMLSCRGGWGGVGVMITFLFFAHMVDATLLAVFLPVLTCLVLRWSCFRVGGGWGGVGVMITFLFFAHMVDATLLAVFLLVLTRLVLRWSCFRVGGLGWGGGDDHVPVLCTYGGCYATCSVLACAHMLGATLIMLSGWSSLREHCFIQSYWWIVPFNDNFGLFSGWFTLVCFQGDSLLWQD